MIRGSLGTYFVLEAGKSDPENLEQVLQSVVRKLNPPLFENRLFRVLQDP